MAIAEIHNPFFRAGAAALNLCSVRMMSMAVKVSIAAIFAIFVAELMMGQGPFRVNFTDGTGFCRTWAEILQRPKGGCLTDDISKPLALILSSSFDWNGALKANLDAYAVLAKTHTVCHRYFQNSWEAEIQMIHLGRQKKIDLLALRAHGGPIFQQYENELATLYNPLKFFDAFQLNLATDATIILESCSGAAKCGMDDYAGYIRSIAPPLATIYAATQGMNWIDIQSGAPPKVSLCYRETDVTYRSGADGYCNTPHFGEAQIGKLQSLSWLVAYGQAIDPAISAASDAFQSKDTAIRDNAVELFGEIFKKGQGIDAAIRAASEAIKSPDSGIRDSAIELFEELFKIGQGIDAAIRVASEAFKSKDVSIRDQAIGLFGKLFEKVQGVETAIGVASEAFKSTDCSVRYGALGLYRKLVEKGQAIEESIRVASVAFKSADSGIYYGALSLYEKIVEQGQGIDAAISAASEAVKSPDSRICVEKGQGIDAAVDAASIAFKSKDSGIRDKAIALFGKVVVKKGQDPVRVARTERAMDGVAWDMHMLELDWAKETSASSDKEKSLIRNIFNSNLPRQVRKGDPTALGRLKNLWNDGTLAVSEEEKTSIMADFKASMKQEFERFYKPQAMAGDSYYMKNILEFYWDDGYISSTDQEKNAIRDAYELARGKK